MAKRWLYLPVFGAFALGMTLVSPTVASAQWGSDRGWDRGWDRSGNYGYDNGFRAGAREGERDARDGRRPGFRRDDAYEDADWGFRGGDKNRYRYEFRRGYEAGYNTAYSRFTRGGWSDNRSNFEVVVPAPVNPGWSASVTWGNNPFGRVAYDNGYRDGVEEGRNDFRRERSYGPYRCDRFRDGDHGFEGRFGSRDAYRTDYRSGFRSGYDAGYGSRRW
jgi:hypothetical protein